MRSPRLRPIAGPRCMERSAVMSSAAWILAVVHGTAASRSRPQGAGARNKARVRSCCWCHGRPGPRRARRRGGDRAGWAAARHCAERSASRVSSTAAMSGSKWLPLMNASTLRPVRPSTAWRKFGLHRLLEPVADVVNRAGLSCPDQRPLGRRQGTRASASRETRPWWKVEALLGPRPRCSVWIPTSALVIAALSPPPLNGSSVAINAPLSGTESSPPAARPADTSQSTLRLLTSVCGHGNRQPDRGADELPARSRAGSIVARPPGQWSGPRAESRFQRLGARAILTVSRTARLSSAS